MKAFSLIIGLIIGAALTRAYDHDHIAPVVIGPNVHGLPCAIYEDKIEDCLFSGGPHSLELSSSVQAGPIYVGPPIAGLESGHFYIKDEHGYHLRPPIPNY